MWKAESGRPSIARQLKSAIRAAGGGEACSARDEGVEGRGGAERLDGDAARVVADPAAEAVRAGQPVHPRAEADALHDAADFDAPPVDRAGSGVGNHLGRLYPGCPTRVQPTPSHWGKSGWCLTSSDPPGMMAAHGEADCRGAHRRGRCCGGAAARSAGVGRAALRARLVPGRAADADADLQRRAVRPDRSAHRRRRRGRAVRGRLGAACAARPATGDAHPPHRAVRGRRLADLSGVSRDVGRQLPAPACHGAARFRRRPRHHGRRRRPQRDGHWRTQPAAAAASRGCGRRGRTRRRQLRTCCLPSTQAPCFWACRVRSVRAGRNGRCSMSTSPGRA